MWVGDQWDQARGHAHVLLDEGADHSEVAKDEPTRDSRESLEGKEGEGEREREWVA